MAARQIIVGGAMPSRNAAGRSQPAKLRFYSPGTTTPATVYTTSALDVAHPFPLESDSAGRFPQIWADETNSFDVAWTTDEDVPLRSFSGIQPLDDAVHASVALAEAEADRAEAAADEAEEFVSSFGSIAEAVETATDAAEAAEASAATATTAQMSAMGFSSAASGYSDSAATSASDAAAAKTAAEAARDQAQEIAVGDISEILDAKAEVTDPRFTRMVPETQDATYTFGLADAGTEILHTSASAHAWTIPPNSSVAFPLGTVIGVTNIGAGAVTLTRGSGVVLRQAGPGTDANRSVAQWGWATLKKVATDTWLVTGAGLS